MDTNSIIRVSKRSNPFAQIDKRVLQDTPTLSFKAKGILCYMLTFPDNWEFHFGVMLKSATDGKDSLRSGMKELVDAGYLHKQSKRDEKGQFCGYEYIAYEEPITTSEHELTENGKSAFGKPALTNIYTTNKEQLIAAEPQIKPNSESFDQFSEKYELQFTPAILSDAKAKLELYYQDNDLSQELELSEPISQEKFKEELLSFLTKRVEGQYKKQFKSFAAMHTDFLAWVKKSLSYQKYSSKEKAPSSSAPLPHREAHELDDTALQAAIDELGVADKTTAGRVRNRIKPLLLFIKNKAAKLGVVQKMSGLTELQCVAIIKMLNFAQTPQFSTIEGIIDQIPQRKDLMQCSSIGEVLRAFSNQPK